MDCVFQYLLKEYKTDHRPAHAYSVEYYTHNGQFSLNLLADYQIWPELQETFERIINSVVLSASDIAE